MDGARSGGIQRRHAMLWTNPQARGFHHPDLPMLAGFPQRLSQHGLEAFLTFASEAAVASLAAFPAYDNDITPRRWAGVP